MLYKDKAIKSWAETKRGQEIHDNMAFEEINKVSVGELVYNESSTKFDAKDLGIDESNVKAYTNKLC